MQQKSFHSDICRSRESAHALHETPGKRNCDMSREGTVTKNHCASHEKESKLQGVFVLEEILLGDLVNPLHIYSTFHLRI